jgi:heat shock protein HslJ
MGEETSLSSGIIDRKWELVGLHLGDEERLPERGRFTLLLESEGKARIRVDCNRAFCSYRLDDEDISFGPIASTMAYCGDDSMDTDFMRLMDQVHFYTKREGALVLVCDEGELVFAPEE